MRSALYRSLALIALSPVALFAQEEGGGSPGLVSINAGLMLWTLVIFIGVMIILSRYAFGPLTRAVEAREKALQEAIDAAKRDREEAAKLLAQHQAAIEAARGEAQKFIAEGRAVGEKMRGEIIEHARAEQQQILERARAEIASERDKAIAQLRHEAVELAVKGASRVIEKNLDDATNRALVENFLASLKTDTTGPRNA